MVVLFAPERAEQDIEQLSDLLIDAVDCGASVGFMPPLLPGEALNYWRGVIDAMRQGSRVLLVAVDGNMIQGSVQIALEIRANGNHRAEAMKFSSLARHAAADWLRL